MAASAATIDRPAADARLGSRSHQAPRPTASPTHPPHQSQTHAPAQDPRSSEPGKRAAGGALLGTATLPDALVAVASSGYGTGGGEAVEMTDGGCDHVDRREQAAHSTLE